MIGPEGSAITFKGGHESDGKAFVVPEGPDVEQVNTTIHTLPATAARLAQGAVAVWFERGSYYALSSPSMSVEQLVAFGDRLRPIDEQSFFRNIGAVSPFQGNAPSAGGIVDSGNAPHQKEGPQSPKAGSQPAAALPIANIVSRAAAPARLVIKELGVDVAIHGVGPDRNGDLIVPKHDVGWYQASGRPTEGTKVILWGHVMRWKDSPQIPAPFADLHTLRPGDRLTVVTSDGERHTYAVERQLRITPDQVGYLAPTPFEELMLISCIGDKIYVNGELTKTERLLTIAKPLG
jgi:sortase (surface protein transpeptidase)